MNQTLKKLLDKYKGYPLNQELIASIREDVWTHLSNPLRCHNLPEFSQFDIIVLLGTLPTDVIIQSSNPVINEAIQKFFYTEEEAVIELSSHIKAVKLSPDSQIKIGFSFFQCSCGANVFKRIISDSSKHIFRCNCCNSLYEGK